MSHYSCHVSLLMSHYSCLTTHVMSHYSCHVSLLMSCLTTHVSLLMSLYSCLTTHVSLLMSYLYTHLSAESLQSIIDCPTSEEDLSHAITHLTAKQMLEGMELYMKESLTALRQIENVVFSSFAIGEALIDSTSDRSREYDSMIEDSSPESDEKYSQQQQYHQVHHYPHQQHHHRKEHTSHRPIKKNFATMEINRSAIVEFNLLNHLEDIFLSLQTHDNFMTDIYWEVDTRFLNLSTVHASFPSAITMVVLYTVSQISIKFTKVVLRFFFEPITNLNRCQYPELKNELLEGNLRILAIPSHPYVSGFDASSIASVNSPRDITINNNNNNSNNDKVNNNDSNNNDNLIATSSAKSVKIRSFLMNRNITGSFIKRSFNSNNPAATSIANAVAAAAAAVNSSSSGTTGDTTTLEADPETTSEKITSSSGSVNNITRPEDDHASCELGKYGFQPVTKVLGVLNGGVVHGEASVYALLASVEGSNNPRELFTNYVSMNYKRSDVMLFWVPCYVMFPSSEHDNISFSDHAVKNDFTVQVADAFALTASTVLRRVSLNSAPTTTNNSFASSDDGGDKFSMTMLINEKQQQRRPDDIRSIAITADRNDSSNSKVTVGSNEVKGVSSVGNLSSDELFAIQSVSNAVQSAHAESSSFSRNRQELHVLIVEVNMFC